MTTNSGAPSGARSDLPNGAAQDLAARLNAQLPGVRLPEVPRRFAIFRSDDDDPELYLWGLQTADRAVAFDSGGGVRRSPSAERIADRVDMVVDAYLVWLDPAADDDPPTAGGSAVGATADGSAAADDPVT